MAGSVGGDSGADCVAGSSERDDGAVSVEGNDSDSYSMHGDPDVVEALRLDAAVRGPEAAIWDGTFYEYATKYF